MTSRVFISYSSKNQDIADSVRKEIESQGISCWIAPRDVPPGMDYAQSILEAIAAAKVMVVVFSSHSNLSVYVLREVERAIFYNATIIPFRIEKILPTNSMEFYLSTVHWLDAIPDPVENHFNKLCERVRQIIAGTDSFDHVKSDRTITAKHRKAFNLAYNTAQNTRKNPPHGAFWLGSRYLPGFELYEITRKLNLQERQLVDEALFGEFEKYENELGLDLGFNQFFISINREQGRQREISLRQDFLNNALTLIEQEHEEKVVEWWVLGISISTVWFWIQKTNKKSADSMALAKIGNTFNSMNTILQLIDLPTTLQQEFSAMWSDSLGSIDPLILLDRVMDWTIRVEMYLLVEEYDISCENAEILMEVSPQLATVMLHQYLKKNPDDGDANILIGKASLKIISGGSGLEPLFRTDPERILTTSMKKIIQVQPDSDWSKRARMILEKIKRN